MSWLEIVLVIGIVAVVLYQQFAGQPLPGKRLIVLPVVVTVIGVLNLRGHHLGPADIAWLSVGAAGSLLVGIIFGLVMRLESRDGGLWGKLPGQAAWLWVALIGWRPLIMLLASRTGAHVAASAAPLLFTLGLNRIGQAAVVAVRAAAAGIPFAPERDGSRFGATPARGHDQRASRRY
jgi:hypothetical protein